MTAPDTADRFAALRQSLGPTGIWAPPPERTSKRAATPGPATHPASSPGRVNFRRRAKLNESADRPQIVMARLVRATYCRSVPLQVARTSRAMTI